MKAAVYNRGGVQIKDVEKPVSKDNEVLGRVSSQRGDLELLE